MVPIIAGSFGLVTGGLIKNRGELIILGLLLIIVIFVLGKCFRTK
tara:strand:+ start:302 stop:436 length:135 start_codon:yes stop_codon:yes gene_type:complete